MFASTCKYPYTYVTVHEKECLSPSVNHPLPLMHTFSAKLRHGQLTPASKVFHFLQKILKF